MSVVPTAEDVATAAQRLEGAVRSTPTFIVAGLELGVAELDAVTLKLEYLQYSGSFKARGATHFMACNPIGPAGVVAASGGNHGAAVAWAARRNGHAATIFVPTISSPVKVDRLREYGADVHQIGDVYAESLAASEQFVAETGATAVHAYNHPDVLAGAGTVGLEFTEQAAGLDTVIVACGGGGLAGGIACAIGARSRVVVVETETTNTYAAASEAGQPTDVEVGGVAADALGATRIGDLAWQALSAADAPSVLVTDDEVVAAQAHLWREFRIVVEPSAATPAAALLTGRYVPQAGERVGVLLCGANTSR